MGDSRPRVSPTGGIKKESYGEKFKKWSQECVKVFKCYNCYKPKGLPNGTQDDPGDRPNPAPRTGTGGATKSGTVKDGEASPQKVPVTHTDVTGTSETGSSGSPIKSATFVEPEETSLGPYVPQLQDYTNSVHAMKDFPPEPLQTASYEGAYNEIKKWILPLKYNPALHTAVLNYTSPPRTIDKLNQLSEYFQKLETAMKTRKKPPENRNTDLTPVLGELSDDHAIRLDEVKSLIILSEAFMEFPQHIIKRAIELPEKKRNTLVDLICHTPYGVSKHVYMDEGPFNDTDLYPIMTRMGFSIPSHHNRLCYEASDDSEDDMLAAGFFLLLGTTTKHGKEE